VDALVDDLLAYIDACPTPYHAVAESARRLRAAGFQPLDPGELWSLSPADRRYLEREGALIALQAGTESPVDFGFRIIGAHTDSPNLRLKPLPDVSRHGYRQLGVEPYGALLLHTWLDRDLSLAGRVTIAGAPEPRTVLLDFGRPLLRIPNLAIHLNRDVPKEGLKLDAQQHAVPVLGVGDLPELRALVARELVAQGIADCEPDQVLGFDLMLHDVQGASRAGAHGEFILAPRLDNLASCHAGLRALLAEAALAPARFTRVVALYDHEEVGSRSAEGAAGPILKLALDRAVQGFKGGAPQGTARALARSTLVSADMAHAVHPNYADRHDPEHRPVIGRGPVLKTNAGQAYTSDAVSASLFRALCARVGVVPQHFVTRSDLPCGSTIGPITAARLGVRAVDVGNPMLSMHSCREMAGSADVEPMVRVLRAFFAEEGRAA
jgi:aspartyl aminopeptidase